MQVKEQNLEEIKVKLVGIQTDLSKINYIESALLGNFDSETKRYLWVLVSELYESRKMYEKAGRAMSAKANAEVIFRETIDSYLKAGELFAKAGNVSESELMFIRAMRIGNDEQKLKIKFAMKNIFLINAEVFARSRRNVAVVFYERLMELKLEADEKQQIKQKLMAIYQSLGRFKDVKLLEGR
jgi:hypothetical protein